MTDFSTLTENKEIKPKGIAYGAASLTRVLNGIVFPVTKQELINKYGHKEVQYSKGNPRTLDQIVINCNKDTFTSMSELVEACARRSVR